MRLGGPQITYVRGGYYALPAVDAERRQLRAASDRGRQRPDLVVLPAGRLRLGRPRRRIDQLERPAPRADHDRRRLERDDRRPPAPAFPLDGIAVHGAGASTSCSRTHRGAASGNTVRNNVIHDGSYDTTPIFGYGGGGIYGNGNIPNTTVDEQRGLQPPDLRHRGRRGNAGRTAISTRSGSPTTAFCRPAYWSRTADRSTSRTRTRGRPTSSSTTTSSATAGSPASRPGASTSTTASREPGSATTSPPGTSCGHSRSTAAATTRSPRTSSTWDRRTTGRSSSIRAARADRMTGNTLSGNVIVSVEAGGWYEGSSFGAAPTIRNNAYHAYAGAPVYTGGLNGLERRCVSGRRSIRSCRAGRTSWPGQPGLQRSGLVHSAAAVLGAAWLLSPEDRHASFAAVLLLTGRPVRNRAGATQRARKRKPKSRNRKGPALRVSCLLPGLESNQQPSG